VSELVVIVLKRDRLSSCVSPYSSTEHETSLVVLLVQSPVSIFISTAGFCGVGFFNLTEFCMYDKLMRNINGSLIIVLPNSCVCVQPS